MYHQCIKKSRKKINKYRILRIRENTSVIRLQNLCEPCLNFSFLRAKVKWKYNNFIGFTKKRGIQRS